ncbi:hypothetical protein [Helicobacter sp. 23-1045]
MPRFCESQNLAMTEIFRFAQYDKNIKIICVSKLQFVEFANEVKQPSK